ncbi:hypothetical protein [Paenibacillus sp. FSL E2-0177]
MQKHVDSDVVCIVQKHAGSDVVCIVLKYIDPDGVWFCAEVCGLR